MIDAAGGIQINWVNGSTLAAIHGFNRIKQSIVFGSITLDSAPQEVYSGFPSLNNQMSGEFPRLLREWNAISRIGNAALPAIAPNRRSL